MNQLDRSRFAQICAAVQAWPWMTWPLIGIVIGLVFPPLASAQNTPASCIVTTHGGRDLLDITFFLECSSVESNGALHFEVQSIDGPSSSDRELEIVFSLAPLPEGRLATIHRQTILLKEGASTARGLLPFVLNGTSDNSQQRFQFWNVGVYEDQRDIEGTRAVLTAPGAQYAKLKLNTGERPPDMMQPRGLQSGAVLHILDSTARYDSELGSRTAFHIIKDANRQAALDQPILDLSRDFMRMNNARHVESAPEYWQYYLQFNAVTIQHATLIKLRTERPLAAEALKRYVAAGGDLIHISVDSEGPSAIDQWLMDREDAHNPSVWATDDRAFQSQAPPDANISAESISAEDATTAATSIATKPATAQPPAPQPPSAGPAETAGDDVPSPQSFQRLAVRPYVRGRVICLRNTKYNAIPVSAVTTARATPIGIATSSAQDESWALRNMIASVGKPPVWTFCGIILLFGLILGPGLLVLTGWIGRRSLLILLVPLVSLGATLAIVAYEVLHEGFGTHVRISSVLTIDQPSGDGFVWSRQNFFSGWPPREGITIPNNVYCRPVGASRLGRTGIASAASGYQYSVEHGPDVSIWRGVLQSREQKQLLLGHPAKLSMPIEVKRIDDTHASLRNLTDETLPFVVARDGKSGYYFAESVPAKAELELTSVAFSDISGSLSRLRTSLAPTLPAELRTMGWGFSQEFSGAEVLDQEWVGAMAEQSGISTINPYGFVTAIRQCDAVFVPLKANTSEALHLVTGRALW